MKDRLTLTVASLITIVLLVLHLSIEIAHAIEPGTVSTYIGIFALVLVLYGTLVLGDRRSGLVIMLLGGILGAGVPMLHMRGAGMAAGKLANSSHGLLWVFSNLLLGLAGTFVIVLAVRGLWRSRVPTTRVA